MAAFLAAGAAASVAADAVPQAVLDQSGIDDLFGDDPLPEVEQPKTGFSALVEAAVVRVDRLPVLNIVVDRLARLLTTSMRQYTGDNADVQIDRTRPARVGDFLMGISLPALIAVIRVEEWDGYCLVAIDSRLITSVVDTLLGGRKNAVKPIDGRPYTPIEVAFVRRLVEKVITNDLRKAFEGVCEVTFSLERFETTPSYAAITKTSAAAVTFRANVEMDGRGGFIDFLFPYAVLEPVRDILSQEFVGKRSGGDVIWRSHLQQMLPAATVELRAVVEQRQVSSEGVRGWAVGSVIELESRPSEPIDLVCEDAPVAEAMMVQREGRMALEVQDVRVVIDWPQ